MSERGYNVGVDITKTKIPAYLENPVGSAVSPMRGAAGPAKVVCTIDKVFVFRIEWPRPNIQRNDG